MPLAVMAVVLALVPAAVRAAGPVSWAAPTWADRATPYFNTYPLEAVSCAPSGHLCAAIEQGGDTPDQVWFSRDPSAGGSTWHPTVVAGLNASGGGGISCPSTSLCVAVAKGNVFTSTGPSRPGSWKSGPIDTDLTYGGLQAVSCPSTSDCVAVDSDGHIFYSRSPASGATSWTKSQAAGNAGGVQYLSCAPLTTFCAEQGYDDVSGGERFLSTNDPRTATSWTASSPTWAATVDPDGLSCSARNLCVASTDSSSVETTTDPEDATPVWTPSSLGNGGAATGESISCDRGSPAQCVIGGYGQVFTSTQPSTSTWSATNSLTGTELSGMSCPSTGLCVGVSHDGSVYFSVEPISTSNWSQATVDANDPLLSVACSGSAFCVGGDHSGRALASATPASGSTWTPTSVPTAPTGTSLFGLSCTGSSLCAGTDGTNVFVSSDPVAATSAWTATDVDSSGDLVDTSCPSAHLCAAVDDSDLFVSTDPAASTPTWTKRSLSPAGKFRSISCPTSQLCVWVDSEGEIFTSTTQGERSTHVTLPGSPDLVGVSCSSASLCAAVAAGGKVAVSTRPTGAASAWTVSTVETPGASGAGIPASISCPSALCAIVDNSGQAYANADVASASSKWTATAADPGLYLTSVSCPPFTYHCFAVDFEGQMTVGTVAHEILSVRQPGDGSGAVRGAQISCPHTCSAGYPAGTQVTLSARASPGSIFSGWSGACTGAGACTITMSLARKVVARFVIPPPHGTRITSANINSSKGTATFKFTAAGTVSGYTCVLEKGSIRPRLRRCASPKSYHGLKSGHYTFVVEAYNTSAGDPHPARKTFTIK